MTLLLSFPSFRRIVVLTVIFQTIYAGSAIKHNFFTTRGIDCASSCEKKGTEYYWCYLADKKWDYCSPSPSVDYKGRPCQDKCGLHGHSYEWCTTEDGDWGYCSRQSHQILLEHFGSFEDKECTSTCSKHGKSYYWCSTGNSNWDYCSHKEGHNSAGTKCKTKCGKEKDTKYQWCYDVKGKWQYCSRVKPIDIDSPSAKKRRSIPTSTSTLVKFEKLEK